MSGPARERAPTAGAAAGGRARGRHRRVHGRLPRAPTALLAPDDVHRPRARAASRCLRVAGAPADAHPAAAHPAGPRVGRRPVRDLRGRRPLRPPVRAGRRPRDPRDLRAADAPAAARDRGPPGARSSGPAEELFWRGLVQEALDAPVRPLAGRRAGRRRLRRRPRRDRQLHPVRRGRYRRRALVRALRGRRAAGRADRQPCRLGRLDLPDPADRETEIIPANRCGDDPAATSSGPGTVLDRR